MKSSQLNRVLGLVKKTGDRLVVMDAQTDEVVVIMRLEEYENLLGPADWQAEPADLASADDWDIPESPANFELETASAPAHPVAPTVNADDEWQLGTPVQPTSYAPLPVDSLPKAPIIEQNSPEQGVSDIPHEESDPPFYLEPVE